MNESDCGWTAAARRPSQGCRQAHGCKRATTCQDHSGANPGPASTRAANECGILGKTTRSVQAKRRRGCDRKACLASAKVNEQTSAAVAAVADACHAGQRGTEGPGGCGQGACHPRVAGCAVTVGVEKIYTPAGNESSLIAVSYRNLASTFADQTPDTIISF